MPPLSLSKMFDQGFLHRLRISFDRVLYGFDLAISLATVTVIYSFLGPEIMQYQLSNFVAGATSLSSSLIAVILTGVAILVSLSNSEAIQILKENRLYKKFLFTFEFTAMLALSVSVFGILLQTYDFGVVGFYSFLWLFLYMVLAAATVVSRLITYGNKLANIAIIKHLPDDLDEGLSHSEENEQTATQKEGKQVDKEAEY